MFEFLKNCDFGPKNEEISMVCAHLLMEKEEKIIFTHESKRKLAELLESKMENFDFKPDAWLLKNYKSIFDQGLFYQNLAQYLNENSADQNPVLVKVLLMAIVSRGEEKEISEIKKVLLSDV